MLTAQTRMFVVSSAISLFGLTLVGAQTLPCWKTVNDTFACALWILYAEPPTACGFDADIDQDVYRAVRAASPWSEPIVQIAECSGTYYTRNKTTGECDVPHSFAWQTSGTQGGGSGCPAGGGGGS